MRKARWLVSALSAIALATGGLVGSASTALAALPNTPDATWMTNGAVWSIIRSGDYIYVGGQFTRVRELPPGVVGGDSFAANGLARFDAVTGVGDPTWTPDISWGSYVSTKRPIVYALAAAGGDIFVGGDFGAIDGQARTNFGAVREATGAVDPGVTAAIGVLGSKSVRALTASSDTVYAGGHFTTVDTVGRRHLAAFSLDGALDLDWRPKTDKRALSFAWDCSRSSLFVGGQFRRAAGTGGAFVPRETIARFDPDSGAMLSWAVPPGTIPNDQKAYDMSATCEVLGVGYGGRNFASAFDVTDGVGEELWRDYTAGNVQTVAIMGDDLVIGGHFSQVNHERRIRIASVDLATGALTSWNPEVDGQFYGPWDLLVTGDRLYVGGFFTSVAGSPQYFFARFTEA
ncbi:MAG: hypothetical protein ACRDHI_04490 [Actinomycetota bacterium]